jgi:ABC-type phosphate transport system substrate-binding protein
MRVHLRSPKTWAAGGLAAALVAAGAVLVTASPAAADPATNYVAAGSDTTQDVMNGFAAGVGGGFIGSWNATNPTNGRHGGSTFTAPDGTVVSQEDDIHPKPGCDFGRPNGSGNGLLALRKAHGGASNPPGDHDPGPNCVDIGRSSSGPTVDASGKLVYIPFALDAVALASGPSTPLIPDIDAFTKTDLIALYGGLTVTKGAKIYTGKSPVGGVLPDGANQWIHLYVPQSGSGTRNFWGSTSQLNFNVTTLPAWVHDHEFTSGTDFSGPELQEHNGTAYANDPIGVGPFSIAQWIAQSHAASLGDVIDRRDGAVLHNLNGVTPQTGGGTLNPAYPINREVFNILVISQVIPGVAGTGNANDSGFAFDPNLSSLFVGTGSAICKNPTLIRSYGFASLGATTPHTCGATTSDLFAVPTI